MNEFLNLAAHGLIDLPWWGYVVVLLALTHITIASVTIFLHRAQAHRGLDLHPSISHFFRFWLWLTTGMITKEWVAIHRKHHAKCETEEDPHSPMIYGIRKVLTEGAELYKIEARNAETLDKYGTGTPDDWMERNVYSRFPWQGVGLMLLVNLLLFGPIGAAVWALQMIWIPVHAAGVINGIGHYWGYRHFTVSDTSTNIVPIAFWIGGEELHNNHHAFPTSARFSMRWYEFDLGWTYIRILAALKLANVKKVAPRPRFDLNKARVDAETVQAVIAHRYEIVTKYVRALKATCHEEVARIRANGHASPMASMRESKAIRNLKHWLRSDADQLSAESRASLKETLAHSKVLDNLYTLRLDLAKIWERSTLTKEELASRLEEWCKRAEATGIAQLQQFTRQLKSYA
ncbi:MAG: fatty acid desaturase [Betaproteobacteria bacterium]|nr:fatty acid desaturase [Betaproteobacteria bacterium]